MTWRNYDDVLRQLEGAGLIIPPGELSVGTTKPVRVHVRGEGKQKKGWYHLSEFGIADGSFLLSGSYGVWHGNDYGYTQIQIGKDDREKFSPEQAAAIKARRVAEKQRAAAERQREIDRASARATRWWRQCASTGNAAYLERKGFAPGQLFGARVSKGGNLVVPMLDGDGRIFGLQVIYATPVKRGGELLGKQYTPPGVAVQSHWAEIGSPAPGRVLLVCEGFATAASLHLATGLPVIVAFDAGNLGHAARAAAKHYRRAKLLLCADDDYLSSCSKCKRYTLVSTPACAHCGAEHGKLNTGVRAAEAAAVSVEGAWVAPQFDDERPVDKKGATDFNDLHTAPSGGLQAVRRQVLGAIAAVGWGVADVPSLAASVPSGGVGEADEAYERPPAVATLALDDCVERFIFVDDGTGETVFDTWTRSLARFGHVLRLLPPRVRADDVKGHPQWRARAAYLDQVGFDPAGTDTNVRCNLWRGWPHAPQHGNCRKLLALLEHLCSGEDNAEDLYLWVLKWLAYPLQHAGAKMASAVVVHGPQGTGKSLFFEAVARIYGEYGIVLNQGAIEDKFNADWVSRKLFVLADEIVANSEKYHLKNQLKTLITGETVRVNPKNLAAHTERNHMNLVFLSNERQPVVLESDDRRHCVIWTPPKLDRAVYDHIAEECANGGIAALHAYLLDVDTTDFTPWTWPPMTGAKRDLIGLSAGSEERFQQQWIRGELLFSDDADPVPLAPAGTQDVYQCYLRWCKAQGEVRPRPQNQFLSALTRRNGWREAHGDRYDSLHYAGSRRRQRFLYPSADDLAAAAKLGGRPLLREPDEPLGQYLTKCFFAFRSSVEVVS